MARNQYTIPNQVFIGAAWSGTRPKYEHAIAKLKKKYPLSFVIVGRGDGQDAADLLAIIKDRIDSSTFAVFDATGGNANVSLEFGYAEALGMPRAIYLCTHQASKSARKDSPIIADLAGKKHNQYKQEAGLRKLLGELSKDHEYTRRFEKFVSEAFRRFAPGTKRAARVMALRLIHALDGRRTRRRSDVVQDLLAETYRRSGIDDLIKLMRKAGLINSQQGPHSRIWIT